MSYAHTAVHLDFPAQDVWTEISDFGGILNWARAGHAAKIRMEDNGSGLVRHLTIPPDPTSGERLDHLDHENMILVSTVVYGPPTGVCRYQGRMSVRPQGPDACGILWEGFYDVVPGQDEVEVRARIEDRYDLMLEGLKAHLMMRLLQSKDRDASNVTPLKLAPSPSQPSRKQNRSEAKEQNAHQVNG